MNSPQTKPAQCLKSLPHSIQFSPTGWGLSPADFTGYGFSPGPHLFLLLTSMQMRTHWLSIRCALVGIEDWQLFKLCGVSPQDMWRDPPGGSCRSATCILYFYLHGFVELRCQNIYIKVWYLIPTCVAFFLYWAYIPHLFYIQTPPNYECSRQACQREGESSYQCPGLSVWQCAGGSASISNSSAAHLCTCLPQRQPW